MVSEKNTKMTSFIINNLDGGLTSPDLDPRTPQGSMFNNSQSRTVDDLNVLGRDEAVGAGKAGMNSILAGNKAKGVRTKVTFTKKKE
jgi:hypothetical protein